MSRMYARVGNHNQLTDEESNKAMVEYISNELKKGLPNVEIKTVDFCDGVIKVIFNNRSLGMQINNVPINLAIKEIISIINSYLEDYGDGNTISTK